jgi:low affinity Fe/Cu permease
MSSPQNGRTKKPIDIGARTRIAQWLFIVGFVLLLALLWANWFFNFSEAWGRIIKTGISLLVLLGLVLIYYNKRRNAKAVQQKLDELERTIKRTANN